jgi:single-stranded-DNA-specific exonuclease
MSKKWQITSVNSGQRLADSEEIIQILLKNRGLKTQKEIKEFLSPPDPCTLTPDDVGIDKFSLKQAITRIHKAIEKKESIVVYADYDADGITAGAVLWETMWALGARAMPYIPHRVDEGYGLSEKGIDAVRELYDPKLIITVDHGITAHEKVVYAKKLGIDVIVTDHHVKPEKLPDCTIVHTTNLAGSGVSWFLSKELKESVSVELPVIGTIADLVPLIGPNRSIAKYGLAALRKTKRVGLEALYTDSGIDKKMIDTYTVSHQLAPRINAMGRLEHALDALRLLCTKDKDKATLLAQKLGLTNRERQKLTEDSVFHAFSMLPKLPKLPKKLIFLAHESYNQGIIGLVAGKLVEQYYQPSIVVSIGEIFSKASARSISGFNIIEAIRTSSDLLVDAGGHPMAAGFTVETKNLSALQEKLELFGEEHITDDMLIRQLKIDMEIALEDVTETLWKALTEFAPFGFGNPEPIFATRNVIVDDARLVGKDGKHLKLRISSKLPKSPKVSKLLSFDCIAFGFGSLYGQLKKGTEIDLAYSIDMNEWNGARKLQLKVKDITG